MISFLEALAGLDPQSGLLGGASKLKALYARQALGQTCPGPTE